MKQLLLGLLLAFVLGGCEILGPDNDDNQTKRTYPVAMGHPAADLQGLLDGNHAPGLFDLDAYVVGISECPPDHACLIADHIRVAGSPDTDGPSLMIDANKPSQFDMDDRYVLSIEVFNEAFPESSQALYVRLLGYSATD
ncbi:MAG: hypothetical protein O3C45_06025 [Bacteroidetes bacterium]|nr:hypothetical protein [Bacteroidota bacterium]MDA0874606.1 hypothetical protein [Bacteroidota bacterium]